MMSSRSAVEQVGVIAWKRSPDLRVLLIRRMPDGPWGIPKGGIADHGHDHHEAARQECIEEAGALGDVGATFVGEYDYRRGSRDYRVRVLLMEVTELEPHYPEDHFRERRWFAVEDAAEALQNETLRELVQGLPQQIGSRKR